MKLPQNRLWVLALGAVGGFLMFFGLAFLATSYDTETIEKSAVYTEVGYSDFLDDIDKGTVQVVNIYGQNCHFSDADGQSFETYLPVDQGVVLDRLMAHGVHVYIGPAANTSHPLARIFIEWLPIILFLLWTRFVGVLFVRRGGNRAEARIVELERRLAVLEGAR